LLEPARQVADQPLGLFGVIHLPCLAQRRAHRGMQVLGQSLHDVARLVDLAALDGRVTTEGLADRLGQRFRPIDDEQAADFRIQPALDQIVQERLRHGGILRGSLEQTERMFDPVAIDADGGQQRQVFGDVDAVDLDHQQIELGQVRRHPFAHPLRRQRDEPTRCCGLRHAGAVGRWNIALRQPNGAPEPARRDVDQHQVQRPSPQPILGLRHLPGRQRQLVAVPDSHTWPFDRHLAAVEAELACSLSPAMAAAVILSAVARAAQIRRVALHHIGQRRDPRRQAEPLEARADIPPSLFNT
jgi:hypothetical protein